jgi:nucleoside-triphosphatase THEP1
VVLENGRNIGFKLRDLKDGKETVLAHISIDGLKMENY